MSGVPSRYEARPLVNKSCQGAMIQVMPSAISLNTPIEDLHRFKIARLGQNLARKLAAAVASHANKKHYNEATVEDLLSYLPMLSFNRWFERWKESQTSFIRRR